MFSIRTAQRCLYTLAAASGLALITLGAAPTPAHAAPPTPSPTSPLTVSYTVTASETTAVDLDIPFRSNGDVSYELSHLSTARTDMNTGITTENTNPTGYCTELHARAPISHFTYTWYECEGVPTNERPRTPEYS